VAQAHQLTSGESVAMSLVLPEFSGVKRVVTALVAAWTAPAPASAQMCSAPDTAAVWYRLQRAWSTEEPKTWGSDSLQPFATLSQR
jgi:hypothetical protein